MGLIGVGGVCRAVIEIYFFLMVSITFRRMMMNMRRLAITSVIFIVLFICFFGFTVLEFWVEVFWRGKEKEKDVEKVYTV